MKPQNNKYIAAFILSSIFLIIGITACKGAESISRDQAKQIVDQLIESNIRQRQEVSLQRTQIKNGIQELDKEKVLRMQAQSETIAANKRADDQKSIADSERIRANQWEHRTEVIVELFAIAFAFWIGTIASGYLVRNFPAPESYFFAIGVYVLSFILGMYVVNHFIDEIGRVIPTVPSLDEVTHWTHKASTEAKKVL